MKTLENFDELTILGNSFNYTGRKVLEEFRAT